MVLKTYSYFTTGNLTPSKFHKPVPNASHNFCKSEMCKNFDFYIWPEMQTFWKRFKFEHQSNKIVKSASGTYLLLHIRKQSTGIHHRIYMYKIFKCSDSQFEM